MYKPNSFEYVRGNIDGDGIPAITSDASGNITFSWNGFAESTSQRQVVFRFKTINNSDWMKDESVSGNRHNHVEFNGSHDYADAEPVLPTFKKVGSELVKENDGELYFDFDVIMNTITESAFNGNNPIVFTDTYDPHLEYVAGSAKIFAGKSGKAFSLVAYLDRPRMEEIIRYTKVDPAPYEV